MVLLGLDFIYYEENLASNIY